MGVRIFKDGHKEAIPPSEWNGEAYRLVCKACGAVMRDYEPLARGGQHWHPTSIRGVPSECIHAGERVIRAVGKRGSRWVEVFRPKKYRRARNQARKTVAKLASK